MANCSDEKDAASKDVLRRLYTATGLCFGFLIVEVIGGYLSGSLAVLSDAAHLFADLASFGIAIVAAHLAAMPTTDQHTFGLKRSESLAALFSMLSLALVSVGLAVEALRRFWQPDIEVDGKMMSGVAGIGVLVNVALALVLGVEHHVHLPGGGGHDHSHGHCGHTEEVDAERGHGHAHEHAHNEESCTDHDHSKSHATTNEHDHSHEHPSTVETTPVVQDHGHAHGHSHNGSCDDHDHSDSRAATTEHDHSHSEPTPCTDAGHDHSHEHPSNGETTPLVQGHQNCNERSKFDPTAHQNYEAVHANEVLPEKASPPRNINLHAAYLHVLGDLAQSVAVLIAGLFIWFKPEWRIVDPICTLFFCSFVFYSTLGVLRTSISVLLEEVPPNIQWRDVFDAIGNVEGVENVHDLHIWSISHGNPTLSVHCSTTGDQEVVLERIYGVIKKRGIDHATIQVQFGNGPCVTCDGLPCDVLRTTPA